MSSPAPFDFAQSPLLVEWEPTRLCTLACPHCRVAAETASQFAGTAREAVTDQGGRIFDRTSRLTRDLMERTGRLIQEQPLAVAAAGLAIGVAIAAALPRTKL